MPAGLFGFFLKSKVKININLIYSSFKYINYIKEDKQFIIGGEVLNSLQDDRFFQTNEKFTMAFDGVNLSNHIQQPEHFFKAYENKGIDFVKNIKGTFSGLIFDEKKQKIYLFNDHLSTKNIYYFYHPTYGFAFSSSLKVLSRILKQQQIPYTLNSDALYMMSLYGFVLDNQTYLNEVKILPYSSILTYDIINNKISITQHFNYSSQEKLNITYDEAIDTIENLLVSSIYKNWKKNKKYTGQYFTLLSGGMDARVNALIAKELGFFPINSLTFGQSGSKDIIYAEKIADSEGFIHQTKYLDGGDYLIDNIYENYIKPNDGMIFYNGSAHLQNTLRNIDLTGFPIVHSGQIGDVLFGAFINKHFDFFKNKASIGYTGFVKQIQLLDKIDSLDAILDKYQTKGYEVYIYEQRQIHATLYGDRSIATFIDTISPFYDKELIQFCMSLPNSYKKFQMIYFDWLKKYHPNIINYPWDKIEMNPDKKWKIKYGKIFKKYFNGVKKYFHWHYESMNPYGLWLKQNPKIKNELDKILRQELDRDFLSLEIKEDLKLIYDDDIFEYRNKFAVITALLAVRLHFIDS